MNHRFFLLAMAGLLAGLTGCLGQNQCGTCPNHSPSLFGSVSGARIAPPATGTIQYPQQVANLPDQYYGRTPTVATPANNVSTGVNTNQGWRPANPAPGFTNPINYNPNAASSQNVPANTIPANNLVVASSTSQLQPRATTPVQIPNVAQTPVVASTSVSGGMPLNDATRVATAPAQQTNPNTGIFNRAWEYVARPTAPTQNYVPGQVNPNQYANQQFYANGTIVAANSTGNFTGPRPTSYSYQNGSYPNGVNPNNGYYGQQNGVVADGWRQRDVAR